MYLSNSPRDGARSRAYALSMTFAYVSLDEAVSRGGLRMTVVGGVPSPWGEAAKGIFHIKGIEWVAVRLDQRSDAMTAWTKSESAPVALHDGEPPRAGWADILLLAERLAPSPPLLPRDAAERALVFGLAHEICGDLGLAWMRRIQLVHVGLAGAGGFDARVARYLGKKYGYTPALGETAGARIAELLGMLAARLEAQRRAGSRYYVGDSLTAVDVYAATALALFAPLPDEHCALSPPLRAAFETRDPQIEEALAPSLLAHRDMMYAAHLELPLSL